MTGTGHLTHMAAQERAADMHRSAEAHRLAKEGRIETKKISGFGVTRKMRNWIAAPLPSPVDDAGRRVPLHTQ